MDWWHARISPPYYYLLVGVILFLAAVVSTLTGKTYGRYVGVVSRAKEPTDFWWESQYISLVVFAASDISCTG